MKTSVWLSLAGTAVVLLGAGLHAHAEDAAPPASTVAESGIDKGEARVRAELLTDVDQVAAGETLRAGVYFTLDPGWHIYWRISGDSGLPTEIKWDTAHSQAGPLQWPVPQRYSEGDGLITTYGYAHGTLLFSSHAVAANAKAQLPLKASVDFLVCEETCIPGHVDLARSVEVGDTTVRNARNTALFDRYAKVVPNAEQDARLEALVRERKPIDGVRREVLSAGAPAVCQAPAQRTAPLSLALMLLFALLGGLILNAMPCVLPVVALKALAVSHLAHASQRTRVMHAAAYSAGVVGSLSALGAVVWALRRAGTQVGWGFQFQEPAFVVAVAVLLTVFALNLFGVFEVRVGATGLSQAADHAAGARRSLLEGVLTVVLATPCSAPILGTAVGFALSAPALLLMATFIMIGVGLATPMALLMLTPRAARFIPKPGAWMVAFKQLLGFGLLGTVVWLLWLRGRTHGVDGMAALLGLLLAVGLLAWLVGKLHRASAAVRIPLLVTAVACVLAGAYVVSRQTAAADRTRVSAIDSREWQPYSPERVRVELTNGRPVFVDFTADWCITCKVNERLVLQSEAVRSLFAAKKVVTLKADWTRRDALLRAVLARYGRGGVPMYLVYRPGANEPRVLPELLSFERIRAGLD